MSSGFAERVDALCRRRCAFALYALPGEDERFCMAADGRTEEDYIFQDGFLLATFDGKQLTIPAELTEPPAPDKWEAMQEVLPLSQATKREQYAAQFSLYSEFIRSGKVNKIVLARTEDVAVAEEFSPTRAFRQACANHPAALKVLVHTPQHGTWLFCTPEQLITGTGTDNTWHTMALAGTRTPGTLPWDAKNRREHELVTEFMRAVLTPLADDIHISEPETLRAGNIEHLCTRFRLQMPPGRILRLLDQLPPTPAVCGSPVTAARELLHRYPDIDRSCYAGYLGPWGKDGVRLYVSLRCMQIFHGFCRLYAGGGLMPDSDENSEWLETAAKMQTMLDCIKLTTSGHKATS